MSREAPRPPRPQARLAVATAIALLCLAGVLAQAAHDPSHHGDVDQLRFAAGVARHGGDPYPLVGPGLAFDLPWPLVYPLTAAVAVLPLSFLPEVAARALFVALGMGLLAWLVTRDGWSRLPLFLGAPALSTVLSAQWSALMTAAWLAPPAALLAAAKPNVALAIVLSRWERRTFAWAIGGGAVLAAAAFGLVPQWPREWLAAVRAVPHFAAPVLRPFGALVLLALVAWRRPQARLLVLLACVPQTPSFYDTLPLFLVPETRVGVTILALLSYVPAAWMSSHAPGTSFTAWSAELGMLTTFTAYLPCTAIVLWEWRQARRAITGHPPSASRS